MQQKSDQADLEWEANETSMRQDLANMLNSGGYQRLKSNKTGVNL